ncbi:MAG TPA: hypothetical protein VFA10_08435 [Ktedonobacteraceae bacterium]|jgi:hypothetical protein|nr:hypothetical protein [Ktedonobacteraceae bacterium]
MLVRIMIWVLRVSVLLTLILGIAIWTGNADSLRPVHIVLGILVVLSLWILGFAQATVRGGNWGLAAGAFILGLILPIFGLGQEGLLPGSAHWLIQVIHLLLGLAAIGLGEMIAGRYKRLTQAATA